MHNTDHLYTAGEGGTLSGFRAPAAAGGSDFYPAYSHDIDPNQAQIEVSLNQSAGSTFNNFIVPNSVDFTALASSKQTIIMGAEYVASDNTTSTFPDSSDDYCDYGGNSRLSVGFVRFQTYQLILTLAVVRRLTRTLAQKRTPVDYVLVISGK